MPTLTKVLAAIAFVFFLATVGKHVAMSQSAEDRIRLTKDVREFENKNLELSQANAKLEQLIDGLKSRSIVVEQRAREELGWLRHDETMFLLNQE